MRNPVWLGEAVILFLRSISQAWHSGVMPGWKQFSEKQLFFRFSVELPCDAKMSIVPGITPERGCFQETMKEHDQSSRANERSVTRFSAVAIWLTMVSIAATVIGNRPVIAQTPGEARGYSFYSPELQLLAETNVTAGTPTISHEYIWFAGEPIAQVDVATQEIKWTTNDHLGTPLLQTNAAGQIVWRAEREPHGKVWSIRAGVDQHQPLGLPGQEEEQFGSDSLPGSDRMYNIFRWYRPAWSRYTQSDPLGTRDLDTNLYVYGYGNPVRRFDPFGLFSVDETSCNKCEFGDIHAAVRDACRARQKPACANLLRRFSFGPTGQALDGCLNRSCGMSVKPIIRCFKRTSACGEYFPSSGDINLYSGNDGCPKQKGFGYGPTVFHEAIHSCGLGVEPTGPGPYSRVFNKIMEVCTGFKE